MASLGRSVSVLLALYSGFACMLSAASFGAPQQECSCDFEFMNCSSLHKTVLRVTDICNGSWNVNLHDNELEDFPDGLQNYFFVRVSGNKLTRLPRPDQLNVAIQSLRLENNRIANSSEELGNFSSLRNLDLSRNKLTNLKFLPSPCGLNTLSLDNNAISKIEGPLESCVELTHLSLRFNKILSLSPGIFARMRSLDSLHLENNAISSISDGVFDGLSALRILVLSSNEITSLSSQSFQGLKKLKILHLTDNRLKQLPIRLLSTTFELEHINIGRNELQFLPSDFMWHLYSIKTISLWNNNLTDLPVLHQCCDKLEQIDFSHNLITFPGEMAVKSALRGLTVLDLLNNPIRPEAMRWVLANTSVKTFVRPNSCNCGGFETGLGTVDFCLDVECQSSGMSVNWTEIVRSRISRF